MYRLFDVLTDEEKKKLLDLKERLGGEEEKVTQIQRKVESVKNI